MFLIPFLLLLNSLVFADGGVDLHAHMFIEEAMPSVLYRGCFNCPIRATDPSDRFKSKINPDALNKSGLDIAVVSLYAFEPWDLKPSIRRQIKATNEFVAHHNNWVLAKNPVDAIRAFKEGKKILLLSLEGASGIIETDADIQEFIIEDGIRIVTPLHFANDFIGGASLIHDAGILANPWAWIKSFFNPIRIEGVRVNKGGLTKEGARLIQKLVENHVWIDLTHASDLSQTKIISILNRAHMPLLYTHTVLRDFFHSERGIAKWQIDLLRANGGMIGLLPSASYLKGTPIDFDDLCQDCVPACRKGLYAYVIQYNELVRMLSPQQVAIGTDFNAPLDGLAAGCNTGTSLDRTGFYNMGQMSELRPAMKALGAHVPLDQHATTKEFLRLWSRVYGRGNPSF